MEVEPRFFTDDLETQRLMLQLKRRDQCSLTDIRLAVDGYLAYHASGNVSEYLLCELQFPQLTMQQQAERYRDIIRSCKKIRRSRSERL